MIYHFLCKILVLYQNNLILKKSTCLCIQPDFAGGGLLKRAETESVTEQASSTARGNQDERGLAQWFKRRESYWLQTCSREKLKGIQHWQNREPQEGGFAPKQRFCYKKAFFNSLSYTKYLFCLYIDIFLRGIPLWIYPS